MACVRFRDLAASLRRKNDDDAIDKAFGSWRQKQQLTEDVSLEMEFCPAGFCVYVVRRDDGDEDTIAQCVFRYDASYGWDIFTGAPVNLDTGVLLL